MAGLTTPSEIAAGLAANPLKAMINKASIANMAAGALCSLWRAGTQPAAGAVPGAAAVCTSSLLGSLEPNLLTPGAGQRNAIVRMGGAFGNAGTLVQIYDRLAHMGGLNATLTTSQTVNVTAVTLEGTRCRTGYTDLSWFFEIYTDIGTTAQNVTVNYTDSAGNGQTVTVSLGGASPLNRAGRLVPILPTSGGLPIRSIESVQLAGSTGVAGSFGVTCGVYLTDMAANVTAGQAIPPMDWAATGSPTVPAGACTWIVVLCATTSSGTVIGSVWFATG